MDSTFKIINPNMSGEPQQQMLTGSVYSYVERDNT